MSFDLVLAELKSTFSDQTCRASFLEDDLGRWSAMSGMSRAALLDQIGLYLARGFHAKQLTFEFCDAIMNRVFGLTVECGLEQLSDLGWEVYLAFDEGEYYHDAKREEDAVEVYTRPMIARIVQKYTDV